MLRVGLTGGIGAGKSAVAQRLAALGAVIVDADQLAREAVAPGADGLAEIDTAFGPGILTGGKLDRGALAARIFTDPEARERLESIIHPRVRARTEQLMAAALDRIIVNDVPLLVETRLAATYHLVVVVEAERRVRLERLVQRGLPRAEAEARMAAQAEDADRRRAADVLLDNSGEIPDLYEQVATLWERMVTYDENLTLRRPARRPERLVVADPNPTWPDQYARLAARIRRAVGDAEVTLDHVGSTAVPGLPAKDVIDMQLGVRDLSVADTLAEPLAEAGFPTYEGTWQDNPKPSHPGLWTKRLHGAADPGRVVHLHVRVTNSPGWRWALLFRDWLRANPTEVADYAAEKARLVALGLSTSQYAETKETWFRAADRRMEAWAGSAAWTPTGQ